MTVRGPYSKSAGIREQILDAALHVFAQNGYSGATVQQIAAAAGMSKPGVLHHFGSRDALFTAVLAKRDAIELATLTAENDLVAALVAGTRQNTDIPGLVALFAALAGVAATDPAATESRRFFAQRYPLLVSQLTTDISRKQTVGDVRQSVDSRALAILLIAASDGLQTQWLLDSSVDVVGELELLWELITSSHAASISDVESSGISTSVISDPTGVGVESSVIHSKIAS